MKYICVPVVMAVSALTFAVTVLGFGLHPVTFHVDSEEKIPAVFRTPVTASITPIVKAGQIWEFDRDNRNPFTTVDRPQFHVVAVKNGYVKYYFVGQEHYGAWAAESDEVSDFVHFKHVANNAKGVIDRQAQH